jgi:type I restriction-modification system DNA methylase subunit
MFLRRAEDEIEKPELDRVFFEDLDQWIKEFAPVNFLQPERAGELVILLINEDIFGKSYEMFLAANRKDEGIYYTPAPITTPMANSLVEALFAPLVGQIVALLGPDRHDFAAADPLLRQLYQIRIVDMAGGSGGFQTETPRYAELP